MKTIFKILLLVMIPTSLSASDKSTVKLTGKRGHEITGGVHVRTAKIYNEWKFTTVEKIKFLEQKLAFYKLVSAKKIDLEKSITAVFNEKPLSEVFKQIIPGIAIEYQDVSLKATVGSMELSKAPLGKVLEYLDNAAGVNFTFSEKGVSVSSKPKKTK